MSTGLLQRCLWKPWRVWFSGKHKVQIWIICLWKTLEGCRRGVAWKKVKIWTKKKLPVETPLGYHMVCIQSEYILPRTPIWEQNDTKILRCQELCVKRYSKPIHKDLEVSENDPVGYTVPVSTLWTCGAKKVSKHTFWHHQNHDIKSKNPCW
jgi:hypothetical protein